MLATPRHRKDASAGSQTRRRCFRRKGAAMAVRRVVTGHTPEGAAVVVSDGEVPSMLIGDRVGDDAALGSRRPRPVP